MATSMTPEEIDRFLDSQRTLVLVTLRPDGTPVAHPMWFVREGQSVYVNTRSDSLKYRNLLKDNRVCGVIEAGETYFELRGVRIEGCCEPVTGPEEIARIQAAQDKKAERIGSGVEELPGWFSQSRRERVDRGARVILRISMDRVFSWDFSKVQDHYSSEGLSGPKRRSSS